MSVMDSGASGDICSPSLTAAASIRNEGGLGNDILAFSRVWSHISGCRRHPLVSNIVTEGHLGFWGLHCLYPKWEAQSASCTTSSLAKGAVFHSAGLLRESVLLLLCCAGATAEAQVCAAFKKHTPGVTCCWVLLFLWHKAETANVYLVKEGKQNPINKTLSNEARAYRL